MRISEYQGFAGVLVEIDGDPGTPNWTLVPRQKSGYQGGALGPFVASGTLVVAGYQGRVPTTPKRDAQDGSGERALRALTSPVHATDQGKE